jgi:hypothetical protein
MPRNLLSAYRRTGADLPFADPRAPHGVGMEGYFWRFTDVARRRVLIALTGVCSDWSLNAVAAHPGGTTSWAIEDAPAVDAASPRGALGDVTVEPVVAWPRTRAFGGLGPAHMVPGLHQYWHPHLLLGRASGTATVGGEPWPLDGATVYAEKNWGDVFAGHWWWGQAHGLPDDATVCFAGGRTLGGAPTAVVLALGGRVHRWAPPLAQTRVATARNRWRVQARGPRLSVELHAEADEADVHVLPVPVPDERRAELRSRQHLAGHLELTVRRGRRVVYRGASSLAGLERGEPSARR